MPELHGRTGWTIAVLAGGASAEREVSLRSGAAVCAALRSGGHRVIELDPVRDDIAAIDWNRIPIRPAPCEETLAVDAVFIALHGAFGEDGQLQRILQARDIPFTGSGSDASQLAFSKSLAKERFESLGIPTPRAAVIRAGDPAFAIDQLAGSIGYPCVVKPDRQGSSIGVTIVHSHSELHAAIELCFRFDTVGLIEAAVLGDEWTVGLIDDLILPPIRIGTHRNFYDYTAKYDDNDTQYLFDNSAGQLAARIAEVGAAACRALGCQGIARVDLRLDAAGNPSVLEVNTIPGMTDHSLVPKAAAEAGFSMTALCERAISAALAAHHTRHIAHGRSASDATPRHRQAG